MRGKDSLTFVLHPKRLVALRSKTTEILYGGANRGAGQSQLAQAPLKKPSKSLSHGARAATPSAPNVHGCSVAAGKRIFIVSPPLLRRGGARNPPADARKAPGERGRRAEPGASPGDGRAVLERAGSCQSADSGRIDGVAPGDVRLCLTLPEALQRLITLMRGELARASEAHTTLLCSLAAF